MHKHFTKFLQSVVVFPVMTASLALSPMGSAGSPSAAVISPETNRTLSSMTASNNKPAISDKAAKIDAYFAKYDLPMAGYGEALATAAIKNDLPPYLLASIAFNESTACKFMIKGTHNCFGWGGGKIRFKSIEESIDTVAAAISGNDPDTRHHYEGKTIKEILVTYNGPGVNPRYVSNVLKVMDQIENMQVPIAAADTAAKS